MRRQILSTDNSMRVLGGPGKSKDSHQAPPKAPSTPPHLTSPCAQTNFVCRGRSEQDQASLRRQILSTDNPGKSKDSHQAPPKAPSNLTSPCAQTNFVCRGRSEQDQASLRRQILSTDNSMRVLGGPGKSKDSHQAPPKAPSTPRTSHLPLRTDKFCLQREIRTRSGKLAEANLEH